MKNSDWKDRLNVVYSTNPDYNYEMDDDEEQVTLEPPQQNLRVQLDRKNRGGKVVTLLCRHRERSERFGKTPQDEMRSRRIGQRRRDDHTGRLQTKNSRTAEERRVYENKSSRRINPFTLCTKSTVPDSV